MYDDDGDHDDEHNDHDDDTNGDKSHILNMLFIYHYRSTLPKAHFISGIIVIILLLLTLKMNLSEIKSSSKEHMKAYTNHIFRGYVINKLFLRWLQQSSDIPHNCKQGDIRFSVVGYHTKSAPCAVTMQDHRNVQVE